VTWRDNVDVRAATLDRRLADDVVYAYEDWLEECVRVQNASDQWSRAGGSDGGACFAAYLSALDAEEQAAEDFRAAATRLRRDTRSRSSASPRPRGH
jgi:hypothetical protein